MRRTAVYAGSFDPPTNGHLDVLRRVAPLFDKIHLVVASNSGKNSLFRSEERIALLKEAIAEALPGLSIEITSWDGLVVDYCKKVEARVLIRGLRALSDFENEFQMATMNRHLNPQIETLHIMTGEKFFFISSSLIKEVARFGGNLTELVPKNVEKALKKKASEVPHK
jgi:pantetheine-phosphate adenylyltransferase